MRQLIIVFVLLVFVILTIGCFQKSYCGDDVCNDSENYFNCPEDCEQILPEWPLVCEGVIRNGLCHMSDYTRIGHIYTIASGFSSVEPVQVGALELTTDFLHEVSFNEEFEFDMSLTNPTAQAIDINYELSLTPDRLEFYEQISLDNFPNAVKIIMDSCKSNECYTVTMQPGETKTITARFRGTRPNLFLFDHGASHRRFFTFILLEPRYEEVGFFNRVKFDNGTLCGNYLFPEAHRSAPFLGSEEYWKESFCLDDVFYPGAECAQNVDCARGDSEKRICVQGKCINSESYRFFSLLGLDGQPIEPIGRKRILVFSFGDTDDGRCVSSRPEKIGFAFNKTNAYFDKMVEHYIGQDENFLDFDWTYIGQFNKDDFVGVLNNQIIDEIISECGIIRDDFDFTVFNRYSALNPGVAEHSFATNFAVLIVGDLRFKGDNSWNYTSFAHEIGHMIGCRDLHTNLGGSLQWDKSLLGQRRFNKGCLEDEKSYCNLDVCFAELGWADLDGDGVPEVLEESEVTQ
jgi:hypothetical protein